MICARCLLASSLSLFLVLPSCGDDSSNAAPLGSPLADAASESVAPKDAHGDAPLADSTGPDASDATVADSNSDGAADAKPGMDSSSDGATPDAAACQPDPVTAQDDPRTLLVTHPFGASSSECGRGVRVLRLDAFGKLADTGQVLDVGECPTRVRFSPDGRLAFVINNNAHNPQSGTQSVVVLRNDASGKVTWAGELKQFAGLNPVDVAFSFDNKTAYVADYDIEGNGGVHVIDIKPGCWATYDKKIPLPSARATQVLPGDSFAVVMGGKAPNDTAIVDLKTGVVAKQYDLFSDFVDAQTLAVAPNGKYVLVPNSSPYSSLVDTLSTLAIVGSSTAVVPSLGSTVSNLSEPTAVAFSPDGTMAVVSEFGGDKVTWLHISADGALSVGGTIPSVQLAGFLTALHRGKNAGLVVVNAVTDLRLLRFTDTGMIDDGTFALGGGNEAITGDISIEP